MKSKEQILDRIKYLQHGKTNNAERYNNNTDTYELMYLQLALMKSELDLQLMLNKYSLELAEDSGIVKALSWVLDKDIDVQYIDVQNIGTQNMDDTDDTQHVARPIPQYIDDGKEK